MVTIKDIAKQSNVSTATVSRILNNDQTLSVSDETRNRVMEMVKELNYKPLRKKSPKVEKEKETDPYNIGIIMLNDETIDPYFQSIRLGVENMSIQYGMNIVSTMMIGKSPITTETLENLDGLIVIGDVDINDLKTVYGETKPIVAVDYLPTGTDVDAVISDFEEATNQVINYLVELGHTEIAYLGGQGLIFGIHLNQTTEKDDIRQKTFERVMKGKGLLNPARVLVGEWGPTSGYSLTQELLEQPSLPTAIVVGSDPMALGVLRALHEANVKVPDEISVVSFDDIESAAFMNPRLSTVKIHGNEMGKTAVKLLQDRLEGRKIPLKVTLPAELVIRDSCSRLKKSEKVEGGGLDSGSVL